MYLQASSIMRFWVARIQCLIGMLPRSDRRQAHYRGRKHTERPGRSGESRRRGSRNSTARTVDALGARRAAICSDKKWWPMIKATGIKPE